MNKENASGRKQRCGLNVFQKQPTFVILGTKPDNNHYSILLTTFGEKCPHRQTRKL